MLITARYSEDDAAWIARCEAYPSLAAHGITAHDAVGELEKVIECVKEWETELDSPQKS